MSEKPLRLTGHNAILPALRSLASYRYLDKIQQFFQSKIDQTIKNINAASKA